MTIRKYEQQDINEMIEIWNEVVEEGIAFPQEECLDLKSGMAFFASQSYTGVAEIDGKIVGLYILHPTISGGAATFAMRAMPSPPARGGGISGNSWSWTA